MTQSRIERMSNEVRVINYEKLAVLTLVAAAAAVIVTVTGMTSGELTAADSARPPQTADTASPQQTTSSGYFPGQYVNQAADASEHIQAF